MCGSGVGRFPFALPLPLSRVHLISSSDIHTWLLYGDKWPKVRDGPHHSDRCVAVLVALEAQLGLHTCRQLHNSMANQDIWTMKPPLVLSDKLEDTLASGG